LRSLADDLALPEHQLVRDGIDRHLEEGLGFAFLISQVMQGMELDHVFLRSTCGAPEADLLRAFGLAEGSPNTHPGQGTANRRFFFDNAFIESLWIADEGEAASEATGPTMLHERLRADADPVTVSPSGLCFRPGVDAEAPPFPVWDYAPAYLPPGMTVGVGKDVPLSEPMFFFLAKGAAPASAPAARRQALEHAAGLRSITSITVTTCGKGEWSLPALAASATACVSMEKGSEPLMEIWFDHGRSGRRHDFRPALPLMFHY